MSQRSIKSFFQVIPGKTAGKRGLPDADPDSHEVKKLKSQEKAVNGECDSKGRVSSLPQEICTVSSLKAKIGKSWLEALKPEFEKKYFAGLSAFITTERKSKTVYPPAEQVFSWTTFCEIKDTKVVILGQDPYHGPNQAHGLAFSVNKSVAIPPSLRNMYQELKSDIKGFEPPNHGDLRGWAKQGVLMLNACLTVRANEANSHAGRGWEKLTDAVIKWINDNCEGVVFLLWGNYAQV
jgi:uracil-DNA glycosylase